MKSSDMIERSCDQFDKDLDTLVGAFFIWKHLCKFSASMPEFKRVLERNSRVWVFIELSLRVTIFITMGRIFSSKSSGKRKENENNTISLEYLIYSCKNDKSYFCKKQTRDRKIKTHGEQSFIDDFIKLTSELVDEDFEKIEKEFMEIKKNYDDIGAKKVRDKLIAHTDKQAIYNPGEFFEGLGVEISQVESLILRLYALKMVLFKLRHDGDLTKFEDHKFEDEKIYQQDACALLERLSNSQYI